MKEEKKSCLNTTKSYLFLSEYDNLIEIEMSSWL